jgi:glyoxylase-like metal-dependent hydrolase (beta-lactamase superfamily II)
MILERSMHPQFLSNTYLVAAEPGGEAFFVDAGGPLEPLLDVVQRHDLTPAHVLLTHHHHDHVSEVGALKERWPDIQVLIHAAERDQVPEATGTMEPGQAVRAGGLDVMPLHTPGHTAGMLSLLVEGNLFTGDTLFKNSVGGVRAPGSTSYEDLKSSIMDVLMQQAPETILRPGHTDATTVAQEWEGNSFVRVWRGLDREGDEPCTVFGDPATLVVWGDDYDGGHKAWVRWRDPNPNGLAGRDDIVPGSQVQRG